MKAPAPLILAALTVLCGCAHRSEPRFTQGTGDAGQFILRQAIARGGQPVSTNSLPAITNSWSYSEDQYGVIVRLRRDNYEAVEALLRQAFGPPKFGPTETIDGGKLGGYRLTPKGGGIQFGYDSRGTEVIVLRQLTKEEFDRAVSEMVKEKSR